MEQIERWKNLIHTLLEHIGFRDFKVEIDPEHRHGNIFVYGEPEHFKEQLPGFVESINHVVGVVAQKEEGQPILFDVNNYRKERERLISQLARAAARKAVANKEPVALPPMNSYERRIIHVELAAHPEVLTESEGIGRDRHVTIRLVSVE